MNDYNITFNHVIVYTPKVAETIKFYQDVFNLSLIEEVEGYARLKTPNKSFSVAIHQLDPDMKHPFNDGLRLYFEIEELDTYCQTLKEKGIEFTQLPKEMPWGWKHAYLNDPAGHEISLYYAGSKRFEKTPNLA